MATYCVPAHGVAHWQRMQVLSGVEVPQRLACTRIRGFEETLIIGEKYQAGRGES